MAQDWDQLSEDLWDLLGDGYASKGTLWTAWEHGRDADRRELESSFIVQWLNLEGVQNYYTDAVNSVENIYYPRLRSAWSKFYNDRKYITSTGRDAESWALDVVDPLRSESVVLQSQSKVKDSWYGPSAEKYASALQTQTAAIDEFLSMSSVMANSLKTTQDTIKGVMLAIKESVTPVKDYLAGAEIRHLTESVILSLFNSGNLKYCENVAYAQVQFESLANWLDDLAAGGEWKDAVQQARRNLEDAKVRTVAFTERWPKATTGNMQDMDNGRQTPPGGATPGAPGTTPPAPVDMPDVDPDADPTQQPENWEEGDYNPGTDLGGDEHSEVDAQDDGWNDPETPTG